jgi:hypothetical protein
MVVCLGHENLWLKKDQIYNILHEKGNDIINNGRRVVIVLW